MTIKDVIGVKFDENLKKFVKENRTFRKLNEVPGNCLVA